MEHANLISDSEYITLNHQQGKNSTHIQTAALKEELNNLHDTKQDVLTAGDGLSLENNQIVIKPKNVSSLSSGNGVYNGTFVDGEWDNPYTAISLNIDESNYIQLAFRQSVNNTDLIVAKYRFVVNDVPTPWKEMLLDNTSIKSLLSQKQDVLVAGTGITIDGQTISASGSTHTIQEFTLADGLVKVIKHDVVNGDYTLTTFSFDCNDATAEYVITGELKEKLKAYIHPDHTFSNGAVSISYDATNMKLINSAPSRNGHQQGTFTFYVYSGGSPGV